MQAPPPTPRRRSALARYAPFLAVVVIIALVVVIVGGRDNKSKPKVKTANTAGGASTLPITYNEAKAAGTLSKYKWGPHCDTTTGFVAIPVLHPAPCVPAFTGKNSGASAPGVTSDTINIVFYVPKPDPQFDILAKKVGAYDAPEQLIQGMKDYVAIFEKLHETYGRKIRLLFLHGTGLSADSTAARADAIKAADELHAFAVVNGPTQTKAFSEELTSRGVMCVGLCLIAQPQSFYAAHPGLFGVGPLPEQPADATVELIAKQLKGKNAEYAGDPKFKSEPRRFALLTYDTLDSQFKPVWDRFKKKLNDAGIPLATHVSYFLNLATTQEDARTIITKLKTSGATSVIFSGDPILPIYFTQEATRQNYHPEWIISGTVFADTAVFARGFDQSQWAHAFGIGLVAAQTPEVEHDDYALHKWWFGTPPPNSNTTAIVAGDVDLLFTGLQLAGPDLTVQNFSAGLRDQAAPPESPNGLNAIYTYGQHGFWPGVDFGGLDNFNLIWWDPTTKGPDETGNNGTGMYRYVDNARRFLPGHYPSSPIKFFDPTNTITRFTSTPPELQPKQYPKPKQ
ncbi:MAG: hypothetical protein QOH10_2224 [Actinomycetota bacterium]|nr:hypothetical protein [Actinomycetota bacterium]